MFSLSTHASFATRRPRWHASFFRTLWSRLRAIEHAARWREAINERRMLLQMDDRALRDMGVTRAEAIREAQKPFWRD